MSGHLSSTHSAQTYPFEASDYAGGPSRQFTLREQVLWTLLGLALLVSFIALLIQDQMV